MNGDDVRILQNTEKRRSAKDIVRSKYTEQGYDVSSDSISKYLDSPYATTFGLFQNETLYGTISIVIDSIDGLPMDSIYTEELSPWRDEGKKLAEVVQFAVDHDVYTKLTGKKPSPFVAAPLFKAVLMRAREEHIDYLCISINPKHDHFYSMLGFKQIGEQKQYGSVNAPAIARALEVSETKSNLLIAHFFETE